MSWLKLNDGFSALKGQITTFAQEVLSESQEEEDNPVQKLTEANEKIEELTNLCSTQDNEISTLRRQISEFQHKIVEQNQQLLSIKPDNNNGSNGAASTTSTTPATGGGAIGGAAATIEDSWFWESENNTSSSSSKNDTEIISKSGSGGDLTLIPLDNPITDIEIVGKLQKCLTENERKLEKVLIENAVLNEKLVQITTENKELNNNIDELDKQHNAAIENLLEIKTNINEKCNQLKLENDELKSEIQIKDETQKKSMEETKLFCDTLEQNHLSDEKDMEMLNKQITDMEKVLAKNTKMMNKFEKSLKLTIDENESLIEKQNELEKCNSLLENKITELTNELKSVSCELVVTDDDKDETKILLKNQEELQDKHLEEILEKETKITELQNTVEKLSITEKQLQTQIIDLQSNLNNKSIEVVKGNILTLTDIKTLLYDYMNYESSIDDEKKYLEEFVKTVRDTQSKVEALEKKLIISSKEMNTLCDEKSKILHEKDTLRADLMHYEIECAELMKNNEVLLTEIDNLKCGKLETIHENNEDSLVILEQQLEDCSNLNRSLEDEYLEVQQKLEETEAEKEEISTKLDYFEQEISVKNNKCKELQQQIESLENEKCNLIFEINELKTDDLKAANETELFECKKQITSLEEQLKTINSDHSDLVIKLQTLETNSSETQNKMEITIAEHENTMSENKKNLVEKEEEIVKIQNNLKELELEKERYVIESIDVKELLKKKDDEMVAFNVTVENLRVENTKLIDELNLLKLDKTNDLEKNAGENTQIEQLQKDNQMLHQMLEVLSKEKNDLITLITTKHNECLQYHAEVQRLNQLIHAEVEKSKTLQLEIEKLKSDVTDSSEVEKMADQITFLREKSDILTNNLLTEQTNQKLLNQDKQELSEQKLSLEKDLERLRLHLMEVEEAHTQETVELQKTIDETKIKFVSLEDEVKKSSNAYTSASIRANQQTETLQTQYMLLTQQRDELLTKLSLAEDRESRNQAALTNLQCALEQFQRDKDRDVDALTQRLRRELNDEKEKEHELRKELLNIQNQLSEAKNGLLAASRISDQLEMSQITITTLKNELMKSQDKYILLQNKYHDAESNQADKVEKTLVKNLLIGYIVTGNNTDKSQILKLISSVLDFNQIESDRVGLNNKTNNNNSWLNNISIGGGGSGGATGDYNKESLAQAFVKFLEKESQPRIKQSEMPTLLNIVRRPSTTVNTSNIPGNITIQSSVEQTTTGAPSSSLLTNQNVTQQVAVQPILLNDSVLTNFAPSRNSSSILKEVLNDS